MPSMTQTLKPSPLFRRCAIPQNICVGSFGLSLILVMPESITFTSSLLHRSVLHYGRMGLTLEMGVRVL